MKTVITNGTILTPTERIVGSDIVVENGKIITIIKSGHIESGTSVIDACGYFIVPGLIDIHIHGANGSDTMDGSPQAIHNMACFIAQNGVTSFLPTTVSASSHDTDTVIKNLVDIPFPSDGAHHLGIHLEGPYLNPEYRGAHLLNFVRPPDPDEYNHWFEKKIVRLMTIAPEMNGVSELISAGEKTGVRFALGHSAATYEQTLAVIDHGINQVTHIFNGMPPLHHRNPGILGAVLCQEQIFAQLIVDGIHIHPDLVKLVVKVKGIDRTILITDSIRATGLSDGGYMLGDQTILVKDGIARTPTGGLAGSTLTMDKAIQNTMKFANLSLQQALPMATSVPAAAIGLAKCKGQIIHGYDADLVIMDKDCKIYLTMVAGKVVYENFISHQS
jgi:N-acetylglucosamine-6-phosphate deacetylase